jgi:hypothetical protein
MTPPPHDLEDVRGELRRLGYLDDGFERFLLQDALRPRRPVRSLLQLTARVALLAAPVLAFVLAFALAFANGNLAATPLDLPVLFLHLFPPVFLAAALAFLLLGGSVVGVLHLFPVRRIEALSLGVAVGVGALALALALPVVREMRGEGRAWGIALLGIATPVGIYLIVKLIDQGLLSLAIRFADAQPAVRLFSRRWVGGPILLAAFAVALPALVFIRREPKPEPVGLPTAPAGRAVLIGVDGVLPEELAYLLRREDLPHLAAFGRAGRTLAYRREPGEPPASFWTSVATGIPGPDHGVTALDTFRPLGVRTPLARNGPIRRYWEGIEVPLGLAELRPLLANRRRAYTVWELASRGGSPSLAVNWWSTFPAEPTPGLVVAHGAYQLLQAGAEGTVEPRAERAAIEGLAREGAPGAGSVLDPLLAAALPPEVAATVRRTALLPDAFYRRVFAERMAAQPVFGALYLPGLDIAASAWPGGGLGPGGEFGPGGGLAFGDLVRRELAALDGLAASLQGLDTLIVVFDPGRRRSGGEGRIVVWRRGGCPPGGAPSGAPPGDRRLPERVAATLLRVLGLPQSRELPLPLPACAWPEPPATVATYGVPHGPAPSRAEGGEYLESLRSLGYL